MDVEKLCMGCMKELQRPGVCPYCGFDPETVSVEGHYLKPYTILNGKYLVGRVLGEGGFGITYIGYDLNLEMPVAIKEFYPNGFVTRESGVTSKVSVYQGTNLEAVSKWKNNFIKEARTLAKCAHLSGIVGVKDFFEENGTAYIVMEYLEGMTLKDYVKSCGGKVEVNRLLRSLEPVMSSLSQVHQYGVIHRDISPDNIMFLQGGGMKLLDFGAARDYALEDQKSLSVMLKPGYAPEEQYRTKGKQGPWSDVYAFAATIYKCITGVTPPEAMERLRKDELQRPSELGLSINPQIEESIMKGMAVYAENRYQSMAEFMRAILSSVQNEALFTMPQTQTQVQTAADSMAQTLLQGNSISQGKAGQDISRVNAGVKKALIWCQNNKILLGVAGIAIVFFVIIGIAGIKDEPDSAPQAKDEQQAAQEAEELETASEKDDSDEEEAETVETKAPDQIIEEAAAAEKIDYLADAQEAYNSGNYVNSLQYCEMALQEDTYNEAAYSLKSDIYLEEKEIEQAAEALNEGIINTASLELEMKKQQLVESVSILSCLQYNSLGTLICSMDYDAKGNPIRYTFYDENGNISAVEECNYDGQNWLTGMSHYSGSSSLEWKENYFYDSAGYRIGCIRYNGQNSKQWTEEYQNDAYGRHVEVARYNANGSLSWRDEYFYDSDENFVKSAHPSPNTTVRYQCAYVYDQFGNQIEFTEYNENGECTNSWKKEYNGLGYLSKYCYGDHEVNYVYEYSVR